jgi:hypothetical protein
MVCRDDARPRAMQHPHRGGSDAGGTAGDQNAPTAQRRVRYRHGREVY